MRLSKQVVEPRNHSTANSHKPWQTICPQCQGTKNKKSKMCEKCWIWTNKPPIINRVFKIKGGLCRKIPLTQDQYTTVSAHRYKELMEKVWFALWNKDTQSFYAATNIPHPEGIRPQKTVAMQRVILNAKKGEWCDHKNHDTLDNRDSNLRKGTAGNNIVNSKNRVRSINKSGFRGVYAHGKRWYSCIRGHGRNIHLGGFKAKTEAAKAYDKAAKKYHGEFARLNFPRHRRPLD